MSWKQSAQPVVDGAAATHRSDQVAADTRGTELVGSTDREPASVITDAYERFGTGIRDYIAARTGDPDLADDITQDVFLLAYQARDDLRDPTCIRAWLYTTARNLVRHQAEKRGRRGVAVDIGHHGDVADPHRGPEDVVIANELGQLVWEAAAALQERQRDALILAYREELTTAEIGKVLGVTARHAARIVPKSRASLATAVRARLVLRDRESCPGLARKLPGTDNTLTPERLRTVDRHTRSCEHCRTTAARLTRPWELFGGLLIFPAGAPLRAFDPSQKLTFPHISSRVAASSARALQPGRMSLLRSLLATPAALVSGAAIVVLGTAGGVAAVRHHATPSTAQNTTASLGAGAPAGAAAPSASLDEATKSAGDIWADTLSDVRAAQSYRITYSTTALDGDAMRFDMAFTRSGDYGGTITLTTLPSDQLEVRSVAGVIYVHAPGVARDPNSFGLTPAQVAALGDGWLRLARTGSQSDVAALVNRAVALFAQPQALVDGVLSPDPGAMKVGTDVIDGAPVIVLRDPNGTLDVTDSSRPYPVRVIGTYDSISFGEFNAVGPISPPANAQSIPAS